MSTPAKDTQTVTPEGESVIPRIDGVSIRMAVTLPDERGEVCEVYNPAWGLHPDPLVYVYQVSIRPGKIKGWVVHYEQDDRLFFSLGVIKVVLYDDRPGSPTRGLINEIVLGERNRGMVTIPRGVYHALWNIGHTEAFFINMPTRPYDHANPDKYRLPINDDAIPYRFDGATGW